MILLLIWIPAQPALGLTVREEEVLGRRFRAAMFHQLEFYQDPVLTTYLERVGRSLARKFDNLAYEPTFHLMNDHRLNAFAAPGGVVVITRGLVEKFQSVDELAGVLAHELAHVSERHLADRMEQASKIQWTALAGLVAAALIGAATGSSQAASGIMIGTLAAGQQAGLAYSRIQETEADQVGVRQMSLAGYDPRGSLVALERLKKASDLSRLSAPAYLRTHPEIPARLRFLSAIKDDRAPGAISPNSEDWDWFKARLAAESGDLDWAKDRLGPLADYFKGFTELRGGQNNQAARTLARVYGDAPHRLGVVEAYAEALRRTGGLGRAAALLETSLTVRPNDPSVLLLLGQVYLDQKRFEEAIMRFNEARKVWPFEPQVYRNLSLAYGRSGELSKAHDNLAWSYVLTANRVKALRNFDLALHHARSRTEKERIEKRVEEAQELLPPPVRAN
ncbi:MAG: M48 family metalloprotease [Chlorobiales bacterium]|nr:M48 family metalloprotease [Chlorobiales bacterium]